MEEIIFILKQLFAAYPNNKVTEGTVAVYVRRLQDIPPVELQATVDQCMVDCKFLPTIAEIHECWAGLTRRASELGASEAWGMVQQEIQHTGSWGKPEFGDATVARLVGMMGWRELCASENQMADRAHFMKMYAELVERGDRAQRLTPQARQLAERNGATSIDGELRRLGLVS